MPVWTCPKCGEKVENFGWGEVPWKSHRCASQNPDFSLPDVRVAQARPQPRQKHRKGDLTDFF